MSLRGADFRLLPGFERRFPGGPPSLRDCTRFEVDGDVTFGTGVVVRGSVQVTGPQQVPDGTVLNAPHIAGTTERADELVSLDRVRRRAVYRETDGFDDPAISVDADRVAAA